MNFKVPIFRNNQASSPAEAIFRGLFKQVRELLNKDADPNEPVNNKTALILCTFIAEIYWAKSLSLLLLEFGAELNLKDQFGFNSIHFTVIRNGKELLEIFLNSLDFDINVKNSFGFTALHYAVDSERKLDLLEMLLKEMNKYKYSLDSPNKFQSTPLMESIRHLNFQATDILIENGANTDFKYEGIDFIEYYHILKKKVKETPHYMTFRLKKQLLINQNDELIHHDSMIRSIKQLFIHIAPEFDFRNSSKWVTERPKSCISLTTPCKTSDERSWKTLMPMFLNHLEDRFTKSYRKNFSIEKIIANANQFNRDGSENTERTGKGRNNSSKKNGGKSKFNKRISNQDKFTKKAMNDAMKTKY